MDPSETTTVQEGLYVVYLLSAGCERLYLTVGQGCTLLMNNGGKKKAAEELRRRAEIMRSRSAKHAKRLTPISIALNANDWRPELYEASAVFSAEYDPRTLPPEDELRADLDEALAIYARLLRAGRWSPDDELIGDAIEEANRSGLSQAKTYAYHRRIERNSSHSKKVKKLQGNVCRGCDTDYETFYGKVGHELIDAHHLRPLSSLEDGEEVSFDPLEDFAVLCPNCHRIIHRMDDVSDVDGLRSLIQKTKSVGETA